MSAGNLNKTEQQIRFKNGTKANLDAKATALLGIEGEPAFTTDTHQFFTHNGTRFVPPNFDMLVSYENSGVFYEGEAVIYY